MAIQTPMTCEVRRVTRPDTVIVRTWLPMVQALAEIPVLLEGVKCKPQAQQMIIDWVELHQEFGQLRLLTLDYFRDTYGRMLGDLADIGSGETLTGWLLEQGAAEDYPSHYMDVMTDRLTAEEPHDGNGPNENDSKAV
jgi:hypothetical protein